MHDRPDDAAQKACPPWCRRTHIGTPTRMAHRVTLTDAQLGDLTVTLVVAQSERLGQASGIGPHARIDITGRGDDTVGIDLTPREVKVLARALYADGGAEVITHGLRAASAALNTAETMQDTADEPTGEAAPALQETQAHDDGSPRG